MIETQQKLAAILDGAADGFIPVVAILAALIAAYLVLGSYYEGKQK